MNYSEEHFTAIKNSAHLTWSLTALVGIPANIFVLAAIVYFRDMRTISNIYIFNLAVADLLFLCAIPVGTFGQSSREGWLLGNTMCKLYISGNAVSQFASASFIAILSFDRYLAVCRPIQSQSIRTTQAAFVLSVAAWISVILEMTPLFLFVKLISAGQGKKSCVMFVGNVTALDSAMESADEISVSVLDQIEKSVLSSRTFFLSYTFALAYLIPLIAVWFFYIKIILKMCQRKRHMHAKRTATKRKTTKVTIMGLAIVISYTNCLLPFWMVQWSIEFNLFDNRYYIFCATHFVYALQYINSAANPFLYVFLSDSFQKNVQKLLQKAKPDKQTAETLLKNSTNDPLDPGRLNVTNNPMCSSATNSHYSC